MDRNTRENLHLARGRLSLVIVALMKPACGLAKHDREDAKNFPERSSERDEPRSKTDREVVFKEYCRLIRLPVLTESGAEFVSQVLELASHDEQLGSLIEKADRSLAKELNLMDKDSLRYYEQERAKMLRELELRKPASSFAVGSLVSAGQENAPNPVLRFRLLEPHVYCSAQRNARRVKVSTLN